MENEVILKGSDKPIYGMVHGGIPRLPLAIISFRTCRTVTGFVMQKLNYTELLMIYLN